MLLRQLSDTDAFCSPPQPDSETLPTQNRYATLRQNRISIHFRESNAAFCAASLARPVSCVSPGALSVTLSLFRVTLSLSKGGQHPPELKPCFDKLSMTKR